jgi:hypothetical protein
MKTTPALLVIAIAVPIAALNPVTRVVELLEGLSKKLTFEAKEEEDLYDKYVCWAQTVIQTKTATNEAAQTRIESLETYIADIEAGRVEFTSERADLEKQIAELNAGMEKAGDLRDQEHEDFEAAKEEMEIAIKALDEAIKVLSDAGKGKLLSVKFDLRRILTIGTNILSKNDQKYLEQELDADVPRINKKSPFKGKYVAKSKKILQILEDMQKTFEDNLDDAEDKEKKAKKSYDSLMESKGKELDTAKEALTDLSGEGGARGVAKEEAKQEVDDLKAQVEADEGFISDTQEALDEKKSEFKERKKLRMGEIAAISEAIGVLRSDDARDTFKKSLGLLFLQTRSRRKVINEWKKTRSDAAELVRAIGEHTNNPQLTLLALEVLNQKAQGDASLDTVIEEIDKMIDKLKDDEKDDKKKKEECEKDRKEKTKESRELSLEIDDATEAIKEEKSKIKEQEALIKEAKEEIEKLEEELKEATRQREDEKEAYEQGKKEDEAAVEIIGNAMDVLKKFYEENDMVFAQIAKKDKKQAPEVEAGEAPPPPPDTFEGDYKGAGKAAKGIQEIMEMIQKDIEEDIEENTKMEKDAVKAFKELEKDTKKALKKEKSSIADAEGIIADSEQEISDQEGIKKDKSKLLEAVIDELKDMKDGCDFICVNFDTRKENRELEIEGLKKAKTILKKAIKK